MQKEKEATLLTLKDDAEDSRRSADERRRSEEQLFFFDYNNVISLAALGDLGAVYSAAVAEVDCLWRGWEVLRRFGSECSSARAVAAWLAGR